MPHDSVGARSTSPSRLEDCPLRGRGELVAWASVSPARATIGGRDRASPRSHGVPARRPGHERFGGSGVPVGVLARPGWPGPSPSSANSKRASLAGRSRRDCRVTRAPIHAWPMLSSALASCTFVRGELARRHPRLQRGLVLCQEADLPGPFPIVAGQLGAGVCAVAGASPRRSRSWRKVAERAASMNLRWGNSPWRPGSAEALSALVGQLDEAARARRRARLAVSSRAQGTRPARRGRSASSAR